MDRPWQFLLIASALSFSWLGMQAVHEAGHVLAAWAAGETVHRVVLHPLVLSRTGTTQDRHPLVVIWGGPLFGSLFPLVAWTITRSLRLSWVFLPRFFAGFCLIANGAYIGVGWPSGVGDAGDLIRYGSPPWLLVAFGLAAVPMGLRLWHGLGPHFGLGEARGRVSRRAALGTLSVLLVVVLVELLLGDRG